MNYRPLFLIYHFLSWTGFWTQIHVSKCLLFPPLNSPGFPLFFWGSHRIPILPPSHPTDWVLTSGFPWFLGHNWHKPPILKLECSSFPTLYAFPLPGFKFFFGSWLTSVWKFPAYVNQHDPSPSYPENVWFLNRRICAVISLLLNWLLNPNSMYVNVCCFPHLILSAACDSLYSRILPPSLPTGWVSKQFLILVQ